MSWENDVDWAMARQRDMNAREFGNSLVGLGPNKPLGSLGFDSMSEARRAAADAKASIEAQGRRAGALVKKSKAGVWAYVWDHEAVASLLLAAREDLPRRWAQASFRRGEPHPAGFVAYLRGHRAEPKTALFDLIADAYADKTGPGRTDVLPQVSMGDLLRAYERYTGCADPTLVYASVRGSF